jgi:transportin-3
MRTKELLEDNAEQVMHLLIQYAQSSRKYTSDISQDAIY